jgi:integrase
LLNVYRRSGKSTEWQRRPRGAASGAVSVLATLTPDEARRFPSLIEDEPLGPLYTLAMTTGMRLGVLLGLRWQAISGTDLEVRVALIRVGGSWSLSAPKTPKSRRRIALSATAQEALKRQGRL